MSLSKKKHVSKKKKIAWRKHVNISDIEEFLDEQRVEERLGLPFSTLSNDELFKIETNPLKKVSVKEQKKSKLLLPPKCFTLLLPHTEVSDPITKRNRVCSKEERKNEILHKKEAYNMVNGIRKYKAVQADTDRKVYEKKKLSVPKRGEYNENIWKEDDLESESSWFSRDTFKHNLRGTGRLRKIKKPMKSNSMPAIELPHPGMSYNPSYDDHQDLLKIISDKEIKIIKEEKHLNKVTRDMFNKLTPEKRDVIWLNEMCEGLSQSKDNNDEDNDVYKSLNPPVKNKKKSLKQRRKQKEQLKLELLKKQTKLDKKKITDIHQLKVIKQQIETKYIKIKMLQEKRKKVRLLKEKKNKTFKYN